MIRQTETIFNNLQPTDKSVSSSSLASSNFPWETKKWHPRGQPIIVVPQQETGRQVEPISFFLCFVSLMLLVSGGTLIGTSIWALVYKIPYTYLLDTSLFFIDTNGFPLCAGVLSIPCWWIFWTCHNNSANYVFLPLATVILAFSLTLLSAGAGLGVVNRAKLTFDYTQNPPKLTEGHYKKLIHDSMSNALENYNSSIDNSQNNNYEYAWDCVQRRLLCCGIDSEDWFLTQNVNDSIKQPMSCYKDGKLEDVYEKGCLDKVAFDLSFGICLVTGFCFIGILVQVLALVLACYVYVEERLLMVRNSINSVYQ